LPVVPPYRSLVDQMLDAMGWQAHDVVGSIPGQDIEVEAEQLAAAAVMAGCKFEYGRVLRPLTEAMFDERFGIDVIEVTTGGVAVLVIVSGPVVTELGFEYGANAIGGANCRPNATIGRYAQMVRYFCGGRGGALRAAGTMGHPGRLSFLIAQRPDTRWPAFHTQTGLPPDVSAVSICSAEGPNSVNNHYANDAEGILDTIADCLGHAGATSYYWHHGNNIVVFGPGHAETVASKYSRDEVRRYLYEHARRPTDDLIRMGRIPPDSRSRSDNLRALAAEVEPGTMRSPMSHIDKLFILESGAEGGRFSAVIPGWVGSFDMISKKIND
jgi:hypothetical protein